MRFLVSKIPGHEGPCRPTWINRNAVVMQFEGVHGYFRCIKRWRWYVWPFLAKFGEEFHGAVHGDGTVHSTKGVIPRI